MRTERGKALLDTSSATIGNFWSLGVKVKEAVYNYGKLLEKTINILRPSVIYNYNKLGHRTLLISTCIYCCFRCSSCHRTVDGSESGFKRAAKVPETTNADDVYVNIKFGNLVTLFPLNNRKPIILSKY